MKPFNILPTTFSLPRVGERDPYFQFSRAFYYSSEKAGLIRLVRLRQPGKRRGVTRVDYAQVLELVKARNPGATADNHEPHPVITTATAESMTQ